MPSFNKVILMGNLTRDPDVRFTPQGTPVANFTLGINRKYKVAGELKDEASFIDIVVFGKQAENCRDYLHKGDSVIVDGRLKQESWDSKEGQKRSRLVVVAQAVQFMPKKTTPKIEKVMDEVSVEQDTGEYDAKSSPQHTKDSPKDDDIPF